MIRKNKLIKTMKSEGYLFPTDEDSVIDFENKFKAEINLITPKDWENPINILRKGFVTQTSVVDNLDIDTLANLAQAAREGKQISNEIRNKMLKDRNKSND